MVVFPVLPRVFSGCIHCTVEIMVGWRGKKKPRTTHTQQAESNSDQAIIGHAVHVKDKLYTCVVVMETAKGHQQDHVFMRSHPTLVMIGSQPRAHLLAGLSRHY